MMKNPADMTYSEAISELEGILRQIQGDNCNIDALTEMTSRASLLIAECRKRLTTTDAELKKILDRLTSDAD